MNQVDQWINLDGTRSDGSLISLNKKLTSPKKSYQSCRNSADLFHYYAGFSPEFVRDVLACLNISPNAIVMDPWNGSGTTTQVAKDLGFSAFGFDINPVMVIVAKAKLLNCTAEVKKNILVDLESIIGMASNSLNTRLSHEDTLDAWLGMESTLCFRNLERAIHHLLISDKYYSIYTQKSLAQISNYASLFYLALFKTLRNFLTSYVSSNPTWIKISSAKDNYINPSPNAIYIELQNQVQKMISILVPDRTDMQHNNSQIIKIERASSESIPLANSTIDLVITSPPYCTRIDYAIATSPELALLGCSMKDDIKALRDSMIGTPTIIDKIPEVKSNWGPTCRSFLEAVKGHDSKASKSYYHRYHIQYFDSIHRSLIEIDRALIASGKCVIVVQDSYNKDIHNDLPKIFCEMADYLGWVTIDRLDFDIKRTMAGCNRRARKYRSNSSATESVLIFKKDG